MHKWTNEKGHLRIVCKRNIENVFLLQDLDAWIAVNLFIAAAQNMKVIIETILCVNVCVNFKEEAKYKEEN
jgi:hypothetical protein